MSLGIYCNEVVSHMHTVAVVQLSFVMLCIPNFCRFVTLYTVFTELSFTVLLLLFN